MFSMCCCIASAGWSSKWDMVRVSCHRPKVEALNVVRALVGTTEHDAYAEYVTRRSESVCRIPDGMALETAVPLLCAGVTVFSARFLLYLH